MREGILFPHDNPRGWVAAQLMSLHRHISSASCQRESFCCYVACLEWGGGERAVHVQPDSPFASSHACTPLQVSPILPWPWVCVASCHQPSMSQATSLMRNEADNSATNGGHEQVLLRASLEVLKPDAPPKARPLNSLSRRVHVRICCT